MTCLMVQIIYTVRENKKLSNKLVQTRTARGSNCRKYNISNHILPYMINGENRCFK